MSAPKPPAAARRPKVIEQLGRTRTDDYAWMKDDNWREVLRDPKVLQADIREHLEAENAYTKALLEKTEALQAQLFAEMKGRIKEDDSSVPAADGPWEYYARYEIGAEHPVHGRRPRGQTSGENRLTRSQAADRPFTAQRIRRRNSDSFGASPNSASAERPSRSRCRSSPRTAPSSTANEV